MKNIFSLLILCGIFIVSCDTKGPATRMINMTPFESVEIHGELRERVLQNLNRLEEEKYQPQNVFLTEEQSGNWPGDTEGRTILGLVMDAQASKRSPVYLERIIDMIPSKLNKKGYMGVVYEGKMSEQQLSGNGWMLRGLCAYYEWKQDEKVLEYIKSIANNLFVAGKGFYTEYPIDPNFRDKNVGGEAGTIEVRGTDKWILSSDVGCLFIGMEGLIHAYAHLKTPEVKAVIDEMFAKLREIDILKIQAQTHATLTACRGMIRYADITGDYSYVEWAEKVFNLYKEHGMTENHANYNWFERFDTWTEPCAIVDSYMLAVQLWQHTENPVYKEDAELIYYNALSHAQRDNGGFGTDNCPGIASQENCLHPHSYEAHWCCTMRGGEGLGSAVQYAAFIREDTVYLPFFRDCELNLMLENGKLSLLEKTNYPFGTFAEFIVTENQQGKVTLKFPFMSWMENLTLLYNGEPQKLVKEKGFLALTNKFKAGDTIQVNFEMKLRKQKTLNSTNTKDSQYKMYYGPLLLGDEEIATGEYKNMLFNVNGRELTPVYHLMNNKVRHKEYKKQILFEE